MNKILIAIGAMVTLFFALIIFAINIIGDRSCQILIQNSGSGYLHLKTFQYSEYDKVLTVDSIALAHNEKIEIGFCVGCSVHDTLDIEFDGIGFYDSEGSLIVMNKRELISYLETMEKTGCATYLIR